MGALDAGGDGGVRGSSFQLEDTSAFAPECAVLLNLEPDHLDRHGTFERYREAKLRVFANQGPDDLAVAPPGLEVPAAAPGGPASPTTSAAEDLRPARRRTTCENAARPPRPPRAAWACDEAAVARGAARVRRRARTASRRSRRVDGVLYVNDSKATNVASARARARRRSTAASTPILGGSLKGGGFAGLREAAAPLPGAAT